MEESSKIMTISAMAKKLGVNRSSVYRYIEANDISPVLVTGKTRFYDDQTLNKMREHFKLSVKTGADKKKNATRVDNNELIESLKAQIAQLKATNQTFKEQLDVKDSQIASLQANLNKNQELLDHNQQLLLAAQNEKKELQSHSDKDEAPKNGDFKEVNTENKPESTPQKKHWWHWW